MKKLISLIIHFCLFLNCFAQFQDVEIKRELLPVGIFLIEGTDTMQLNPIKYTGSKIADGAFLSGLTHGIAKVKNKLQYPGRYSQNNVTPSTKFLFKFGNVPAQYLAQYYMFSDAYSIRNFTLVNMESKNDHREITTAEVSIWTGADTGTKTSNDIDFRVTSYPGNSYLVEIVGNPTPGEYCFLFTDNGVGAYASVFDFSMLNPEGDSHRKNNKKDKKKKKNKKPKLDPYTDDIY